MHVSASRGNSARTVALALAAALVCAAAVVTVTVMVWGGSTPGRHPAHQVPVKMGGVADVFPLSGPPASFALGHGSLWIPTDGQVLRIDPRTARIAARISVPAVGESSVVAVTPAGVWVAPASNRTVVRIDPTTDRVVKTVRVGFYPVALRSHASPRARDLGNRRSVRGPSPGPRGREGRRVLRCPRPRPCLGRHLGVGSPPPQPRDCEHARPGHRTALADPHRRWHTKRRRSGIRSGVGDQLRRQHAHPHSPGPRFLNRHQTPNAYPVPGTGYAFAMI